MLAFGQPLLQSPQVPLAYGSQRDDVAPPVGGVQSALDQSSIGELAPAEVAAIDAAEAARAVVLPRDFRTSSYIHNGTKFEWATPVPAGPPQVR